MFSNGNIYSYDGEDDILYLETSDVDGNSKNIKVAEYLTDLTFDLTEASEEYNEEQCLEVEVIIEKNGKEITRTLKYIITTSST